jgi:hypothetical protein
LGAGKPIGCNLLRCSQGFTKYLQAVQRKDTYAASDRVRPEKAT